MGTTAEKLTYLNETKQEIKNKLNQYGENITNQPFRDYADSVRSVYTNIFKVSIQNNGFFYSSDIADIPLIISAATTATNIFRELSNCTRIDGFIAPHCATLSYGFRGSNILEEITRLSVSECTAFINTFYGCTSLEKIGWEGSIIASLDVSACPLDVTSLLAIISCLDSNHANTLTLGSDNINKLTSAQLQIITDKGWSYA